MVSQVDDPTYKICKELTRILKPISKSGRSYIKHTYDLKEMLKEVKLDGDCLMASLDIVGLYPSIPLNHLDTTTLKSTLDPERVQTFELVPWQQNHEKRPQNRFL